MAITFFSAPATSQPMTSGFVYTRKTSVLKSGLQVGADPAVVEGHDAGGREPGEDLLGQVGPGEHAGRDCSGSELGDDLGHALQAWSCSTPLVRLMTGTPARTCGAGRGQHVAEAVRRDAHHDDLGVPHRLLEIAGAAQGTR